MERKGIIKKGFVLAGLMNVMGVFTFSRMFSNPVIPQFDSNALSNFGLLMIVIWGMAYISIAHNYYKVKWIVLVFAVEKLIYGIHWTNWITNNDLSDVAEKDKMAGVFFAIYGVNDWIFFLFFLIVFIQLVRSKSND
jgi:uncharacterized membrane protein